MTEEERLLFLEQQRLAEEEMQKNKEDMLAQFLKVCDQWLLYPHITGCFNFTFYGSILFLHC